MLVCLYQIHKQGTSIMVANRLAKEYNMSTEEYIDSMEQYVMDFMSDYEGEDKVGTRIKSILFRTRFENDGYDKERYECTSKLSYKIYGKRKNIWLSLIGTPDEFKRETFRKTIIDYDAEIM